MVVKSKAAIPSLFVSQILKLLSAIIKFGAYSILISPVKVQVVLMSISTE
jgi:hypothetical protein